MIKKILAADPGKSDFAWCIVAKNKILSIGMLKDTVSDIRETFVNSQVRAFKKALLRIIDRNEGIEEIVVERFQQRPGKGGGGNAEFVNIMIGVIISICVDRNLKVNLVQASTWKNHMALRYSLDVTDDTPKSRRSRSKKVKQTQAERFGWKVSKTSKKAFIKDHEFDAVGIAQWVLEKRGNTMLLKKFTKQLRSIWEAREKDAKTKAPIRSSRK